MTTLTKFQIKTLTKIHEEPGIRARNLSKHLWPDHIAHRRVYNTGNNGACTGKGAWLMAGSYVGKLIKKGWVANNAVEIWDIGHNQRVWDFQGYKLTREGERIIEPYLN